MKKEWIVNDQIYKTIDYFQTEREAHRFVADLIENREHYSITVAHVKEEIKKP